RVRGGALVPAGPALPGGGGLGPGARLDVAVDAVEADVQLASEEPLHVGELPAVQLGERLEPGQALSALTLPERLEALLVDVGADVRLGREVRGRRVPPLLEEHCVDRVLGHGASS